MVIPFSLKNQENPIHAFQFDSLKNQENPIHEIWLASDFHVAIQ
jgi:hypothetical protein